MYGIVQTMVKSYKDAQTNTALRASYDKYAQDSMGCVSTLTPLISVKQSPNTSLSS